MMLKKLMLFFMVFPVVFYGTANAGGIVYLHCVMPKHEDVPERTFDFTLDENNETVTFYVEDANATNKEKAFFGNNEVTWSNNIGILQTKRVISRSDLTFTESVKIGNDSTVTNTGKCDIVKKKIRKF
ncbi:hypothetical protein [Neokomagataea anthophila]|uniref:Uncharacterized protein n=1 Tax=Neokomagataea anthophila TaxID=2826925 RepID=A0ABS5EA20_9PROT|nr:hypothetical protein [Neokomagataea anthophila]MBR0560744.1 hypothetical protein [Neokomagataea anthophila]